MIPPNRDIAWLRYHTTTDPKDRRAGTRHYAASICPLWPGNAYVNHKDYIICCFYYEICACARGVGRLALPAYPQVWPKPGSIT